MTQRREELRQKVREFPLSSGVYLMKSRNEKIIYIGKAKNLRHRVRSYLSESKDQSTKTQFLVKNIYFIDYIITKTEVEAFLLEASLIKKHRPRYNIRLKDDKGYPYIRFSLSHDHPRLYLSRKVRNDGSLYFGPYANGYAVRGVIKFLNSVFKIRDCRDSLFKNRVRPCLTYEIGRCMAPCMTLCTTDSGELDKTSSTEFISKEGYLRNVERALVFLKGDTDQVIQELIKRMNDSSEQEHFELAARYRDSVKSIEAILEKQSIIDLSDKVNRDVIGFYSYSDPHSSSYEAGAGTLITTLHVRSGRVLGLRSHYLPVLDGTREDPRDWLVSFINQYYEDNIIPKEILLPVDLGRDLFLLLQNVLFERCQREVKVGFPTRGIGQDLLLMANENAKSRYEDYVNKSRKKLEALELIRKKFHLKELPIRIECFDISHFQGSETVASQVVFEEGVPSKDHYRRYRLRTVEGIDDYKSMEEVLRRRFKHTDYDDPQLLVVDGGKGQLSVAVKILKEIGQQEVPVVGLAKARVERGFQTTEVKGTQERFFLPGRQNPVVFSENSTAFQILVGIRDEAHRFAVAYHRRLRESSSLESELDVISGLGEKRKKILLEKFNSVEELKQADVEAIESLSSFNRRLAEHVLGCLHETQESKEQV